MNSEENINAANEQLINEASEDMMENDKEMSTENERLLPDDDEPLLDHHLADLDLDKLLVDKIGEFGVYQVMIYVMVCLPAALTAGLTLGSVFTEYVPDHRCLVPGCDDDLAPRYDDAEYLGFTNFTSPVNNSQCSRFIRVNNKSHCSAADFTKDIMKCDRYLFSDAVMKSSLVSEFHLVCHEDWQVPLSQSIFFAGVLVGAMLFGLLSDIWGRKKTFMLSLVQVVVCGLATAASTNIEMFSVLQFFTAMGQVGLFQTSFVLGVELVGPGKRVLCGIVIEYFFVVGELYLALVAWFFRSWRLIQISVVIPGVLFFTYHFILPESVRWLLLKKKYNKAEILLKKVADRNGTSLPDQHEFRNYKKQDEAVIERSESFLDLLKRPRLLCRLINVFINWFVITMIYYGLSMNAASLAGDVYTNFALLSLCEIPGYTISYLGMNYVGRRFSLSSSLLVGGISCLVSSLTSHIASVSTIFFLLGKFGATAAFGTVYLYTGELFPTQVRSVCVGSSSMIGRLGAILSPYIVMLGPVTGVTWAPMTVFAGAGTLAGLITLVLPETRGSPLPRSLVEAEQL